MNRTLVIGDIHGGMRALRQILERANVTKNDMLIFLGDYVDGWSQSPEVLDFLMHLSTQQECIFMRGNHDDLLREWLGGKDNELWFQHGGEATIKAYATLSEETKKHHVTFLESLHNYYLDAKNRLFVHAGFTSLHGVRSEHFPRLLFWERTLWETALALDPNMKTDNPSYPKRFGLYDEIFIGHTPVTRIGETIPTQRANIWNMDTGAAFLGPLSILDVDSKEFWQSDPLPSLYPEEKGRN
ncbi:metallophosphatase [Flavobacterium noncentrifugens]|uniref:Serine/threonine protein phosphatase 1 n=1 Tax=Flavobacterium noncentrifugens TaxID=1128970 RepID=A0A1G8SSM7_9FLAO|nr:metallophosphoesterase family protein [Flavobacterium noncentrifugens]GEP49950.1 metallophosphatase [Flavobacterium noncentrifugens]SDJ32237.1 serine/threonine protein phosphatase 1 [Flavobacterium noncentrifugens]